jgi:hypothetical protein
VATSRRTAVPARIISRAVGPEPRSKADPTAVGDDAGAELDCRKRSDPKARTRCFSDLPLLPALLSLTAVFFEMGGGVETVCVVLVCDPPVEWLLLPLPVDFPPLPDGVHSL